MWVLYIHLGLLTAISHYGPVMITRRPMINMPQNTVFTLKWLPLQQSSPGAFQRRKKKMSRLSDLIVSGFTPSLFWCGCSVCSPAPAVCSLPFNNLPLAKSLTLTGPRQHCLHFYTRRWETCGLVRASRAPIPAAGFVLQRSDVTSHLRSNPAWAPSDSRQCRHRCCWLAFQFSLHHEQTLFFEWWHFFLRLICWRLGDIS